MVRAIGVSGTVPGAPSLGFESSTGQSRKAFHHGAVVLHSRSYRKRGIIRVTNSVVGHVHNEVQIQEKLDADPKTVLSIILGGGAGTRLFPLTRRRAKPAVPIGGSYRLVDIPMSNCINSGINKIFILTQFNSQSLNRHISRAYGFGNGVNFGDGFVEVLAATQTPGQEGMNWFQGTADAVRQFIWLFEDPRNKYIENVIILSGDHLYRMDYMAFVQKHIDVNADITISCVPMDDSRASDFGLMKIDDCGRVLYFSEKPKGDNLKAMQVDTTILGLSPEQAERNPYIASMGIYVFKKDVLLNLLRRAYPTANDFGSEIIPASMKDCNVQAYLFNDYWEDIGTIKSFFEANLGLGAQVPKFRFYDAAKPIFTSPRFLPPTKIEKCQVRDSIISHGCFLRDCSVDHSIIGIRSRLESGVKLEDAMVVGADYYETESEIASLLAEGKVPIGIGKNTKIRNCIIDKNARIGKNVMILNTDVPKFRFYDAAKPIFTSPRFLPPTKIEKCQVRDSIISHGCFLRDCSVDHSIIGIRSRLESGVKLEDAMVVGADYYETESEIASLLAEGKVPIGIGKNTKIRNCIIDKNARIGKNVMILNTDNVQEADRPSEGFYIRSGIVIVLKNSAIKDDTVI